MRSTLLLVDGGNMVHRAFYVAPKLTTKKGIDTGAVKAFINILMADVEKTGATHLAVVFDHPSPTWRHDMFPEYKGTRVRDDEVSKSILGQTHILRELLNAAGIVVLRKRGQEADDVVGALTKHASKKCKVIVDSGDKDFAQLLVRPNVHLLWPKAEKLAGHAEVLERFGVRPEQIIEYLMLLGDKVDNVRGVDKVGPKTAVDWLKEHGTLKEIVRQAKAGTLKGGTTAARKNLLESASWFKMSRTLITIDCENFSRPLEKFRLVGEEGFTEDFNKLCKKYNLNQTKSQMKRVFGAPR